MATASATLADGRIIGRRFNAGTLCPGPVTPQGGTKTTADRNATVVM